MAETLNDLELAALKDQMIDAAWAVSPTILITSNGVEKMMSAALLELTFAGYQITRDPKAKPADENALSEERCEECGKRLSLTEADFYGSVCASCYRAGPPFDEDEVEDWREPDQQQLAEFDEGG
jgi:hypothetical protein